MILQEVLNVKRFGIFLTVLALLLALVSVPALAEDDPSIVKFNTLMASLKTKAEKADHIIGPEGVEEQFAAQGVELL